MDHDAIVDGNTKYVLGRVPRLNGHFSEEYCRNTGGTLAMLKKMEIFHFFLSAMGTNGESDVQLIMIAGTISQEPAKAIH